MILLGAVVVLLVKLFLFRFFCLFGDLLVWVCYVLRSWV